MRNLSKSFLKRLNGNPEYYEFWQDFREYCNNFDVPNKKEFVESLPLIFNRIKNDGASYYIYESLRKFATEKPSEAVEVLEMIEQKGIVETLEFSPSILGGLSQSETNYPYKDKILSLINSSDKNEVYTGIRAAYQVIIEDKNEELVFLNKVDENISKVLESKSVKSLGIITRFYNKHLNKIDNAKAIIIQLLEIKNVDVQNEVARSLNEEFKLEDDIAHFKNCLNLLSFTEAKYIGIYNIIRYRLEDVMVSQPDIIIEFIDQWILNNKRKLKKISVLKEIISDLYTKHPLVIENLFLDWLNSDNSLYKHALKYVINDLSSKVDVVGLSKESLKDLPEIDSLYITYMIVGYILDRKYASEMLYNILEINYSKKRIRDHIANLFVKYLIFNYYSVGNILKDKRKRANKTVASVIDQIIDASEQYYKRVSELELINEYEPSDRRMQYFLKQQNQQMQKLIENSEAKRDDFLSMLTNISLKAGKFFFSKYRGEYTEESQMQSFRSSFEVSRGENIDEIGQMKYRLIWQNMKRNELLN